MSWPAKYDGRCPDCDGSVTAGEEIEWADRDARTIRHVVCPAQPEPRPVCGECFMEIALSGACGCA